MPLATLVLALVVAPFVVPSGATEAGPSDDVLREGAEVYSSCSACHQAGGAGVAGTFPPLIGNPNIDDAAYVEDVIRNGLDTEDFPGQMPAQSTLSDAEVAAVIAYIQAGFVLPATPTVDVPDAGPVAGSDLPAAATWTMIIAFVIAIGLGALVLGPRIIGVNDRREITWLDAWMKTGVIVVVAIFATTWVPAKALELGVVQDMPRTAQDLIAVGLWGGALVGLLLGLWYAHRERRI
jgi:mono/diheme cytochrome c family protein